MTKKRLAMALGGAIVLVGCLLALVNSISKLPPDSVKPNAKPAFSQTSDKTALVVNARPIAQAVSVASASTSPGSPAKPVVAICQQSKGAQSQTAAAPSVQLNSAASPDAVLTSLTSLAKSGKNILNSTLSTPLLNVAGSLN